MAKEQEQFFKDRLAFEQKQYLHTFLTPEIHPGIFRDPRVQEAWGRLPQGQDLAAKCFISRSLSPDEFISLGRESIDIGEVIEWQMRHIAPLEVYTSQMVQSSRFQKQHRQRVETVFTNTFTEFPMYEDSEKNAQYGDLWMNTLLALQIMPFRHPELQINTLGDLHDYAQTKGVHLRLRPFEKGLVNLVRVDTVGELSRHAVATEDEIEGTIYPIVAQFLREVAESDLRGSKSKVVDTPLFPFADYENNQVEMEFVAHLARETLVFLCAIPDNLPEGMGYTPFDMRKRIDDLLTFAKANVARSTHFSKDTISAINIYLHLAREVISFYTEGGKNHLWDKRTVDFWGDEGYGIPSIEEVKGINDLSTVNLDVLQSSDR